jgi:ABC-2 type transport system permease protein
MRWRGILAVVRRDLTVALGSKAVVLPALVVPAVLLIVLPALAGLAPRALGSITVGELDALLSLLPAGTVEDLPADPGLLAAEVAVTYLLAPMVLMVPVMFAAVLAADAVAGEKERGTLEGVLLTPLTDRELTTAKLLTSLVPAVVLGIGGGVLYAVVANLAVGTQVGRLVLPTPEFAVMVLWAGPTFAAAALAGVLLVSVRVETTQAAFQLGGVVVVPVMALLVTQATGVLLLSVWLLAIAGAVALAIALGLAAAAAQALARPRLGERLR